MLENYPRHLFEENKKGKRKLQNWEVKLNEKIKKNYEKIILLESFKGSSWLSLPCHLIRSVITWGTIRGNTRNTTGERDLFLCRDIVWYWVLLKEDKTPLWGVLHFSTEDREGKQICRVRASSVNKDFSKIDKSGPHTTREYVHFEVLRVDLNRLFRGLLGSLLKREERKKGSLEKWGKVLLKVRSLVSTGVELLSYLPSITDSCR